MELVLEKNKLDNFLVKVKKDYGFYDCSREGKQVNPRGTLGASLRVPLGCSNNKLSFKQYFFPPVEKIFSRNLKSLADSPPKGEKTAKPNNPIQTPKAPNNFVLFGLNSVDLEAITQLDEIMEKPNLDFFYFQKRNKAVVIGMIDEIIDVPAGGDIIFQDLGGDDYNVFVNTPKGNVFIKKYRDLFEHGHNKLTEKKKKVGKNKHIWSKKMRELLVDSEKLADAVEKSKDSEIWNELAEKCLGCGVCTYVCPLCHCFSIEDRISLDDKCTRCRKWDACTLPGFSKIAGGHSFRPTIKERYYNWFYHKFVRAYREFGKSQCVGCGRCKQNCPAGIDIQEVLEKVTSNG
jgi:ferredoxin